MFGPTFFFQSRRMSLRKPPLRRDTAKAARDDLRSNATTLAETLADAPVGVVALLCTAALRKDGSAIPSPGLVESITWHALPNASCAYCNSVKSPFFALGRSRRLRALFQIGLDDLAVRIARYCLLTWVKARRSFGSRCEKTCTSLSVSGAEGSKTRKTHLDDKLDGKDLEQ